ncbi:polyisoprenoid-binding protein [Pedobacter quisquiliarum]|jgi:polyisoprenoid-binding protein YceI|uniref:Polyisoprenoid-binding protein n=1 Tax=Pedobacter quisquiliarum TaxID=1834438 RepID=A0A916U8U8_9SPHI|nr:YceI family protein [Pedobacter quisquiliarum]GGC64041.1 polyisoprenoid-binding protein [Pedobacter quisquiliarum]
MATTQWTLDPTHSELQFKVKHLMITTVTGSFRNITATLESEADDNFDNAKATFSAEVGSVDTGNSDRDKHLVTGDFFDVDTHPTMTFDSTSITADGDDYKLAGNITIKGVTRPIVLDVEFGGTAVDPWGNTKAGFTLSGKLKRGDFGLTYNATLETGGVMLGDEVKILGELQFVKQA